MKIKNCFKKWILSTVFLFSVLSVFSQTYFISGTVKDINDKSSISFANVILKDNTDTLKVKLATTDADGRFRFENITPGIYKVQVAYISYKTYQKILQVNGDIADFLISMQQDAKLLKEVDVVSLQERVKQKGDTTEVNANAYKVGKDANAEDLVTKMPGITSENGTIKAQGEDVKKVLIDGQEFFGDDATTALKNLPAEIIDKIQVFDRQNDQSQFTGFNDGNTDKTLNIVTKPGRNNGTFGKVFAGYGTDDRYQAGGNFNSFKDKRRFSVVGLSNNINQQNFSSQDLLGISQSSGSSGGNRGGGMRGNRGGGRQGGGDAASNFLVGQQGGINTTNAIGLNYTNAWGTKLKLTGSYFFNNTTNASNSDVNRQYFLSDTSSQYYAEQNNATSQNYNHRINARLEWMLDSSNSIIFTPKVSLQQNNSKSNTNGINSFANGQLLNKSVNEYRSDLLGYNTSGNLLWQHKFSKKGRTLSINFNGESNNKEGINYLNSNSVYYKTANDSTVNNDQKTNSLTNGYNASSTIIYTEPLTTKSQLMLEYTPSYTQNYSDKNTKQRDSLASDYSIQNTTLSNKFDNTIQTHRGGASYRYSNGVFNFNIGANYQYVNLYSEQTYPQALTVGKEFNTILPRMMMRYAFSKATNWRFSYNTNTQTPSISQLQNVIDNSNPLMLSAGNPNLKQQYTHSINSRFSTIDSSKTKPFYVSLNISNTSNYITNSTFIATTDTSLTNTVTLYRGSQLSKPVNLNNYWNIRSFLTYGLPISPLKSNLNINAGVSYSKAPGMINNVINYANTYNFNSGLLLGSNISEKIDFKIGYTSNYNIVRNTIQPSLDNNYYSGVASVKLNFLVKESLVLNTELNYSHYLGLSSGFNQGIPLWNSAIAYKFLPNKSAEIRLSVFDILNQNNSITRTVNETYIEDNETTILKQYYMLTFTYNFRKFSPKKSEEKLKTN